VHVRATVGDSGSVMQDVEKGRATIGLVGQEAEKPTLEFRTIGSDSLVLVVGPGHRWAARKRIPLKALTGESLIIRELGSGSRCALEKSLDRSGISLAGLNITLELGSNAAIKDAVQRGLGVAFLSRLAVQREIDANELRAVTVDGLSLDRHFYLVYHRRRPLSPPAVTLPGAYRTEETVFGENPHGSLPLDLSNVRHNKPDLVMVPTPVQPPPNSNAGKCICIYLGQHGNTTNTAFEVAYTHDDAHGTAECARHDPTQSPGERRERPNWRPRP
jgi:hypothetical protein